MLCPNRWPMNAACTLRRRLPWGSIPSIHPKGRFAMSCSFQYFDQGGWHGRSWIGLKFVFGARHLVSHVNAVLVAVFHHCDAVLHPPGWAILVKFGEPHIRRLPLMDFSAMPRQHEPGRFGNSAVATFGAPL